MKKKITFMESEGCKPHPFLCDEVGLFPFSKYRISFDPITNDKGSVGTGDLTPKTASDGN